MAMDLFEFLPGTAYRADGKTLEEFQSEPLPTEITIKLSREAALALSCAAFTEDRSYEYIAARMLHILGSEKIAASRKMIEAIDDRATNSSTKMLGAELQYQKQVIDLLCKAGFHVQWQVGTSAGDADVVVFRSNNPLVVVELKAALRKRREVLHASGQARAYAEALGAQHYFVSAAEIDESLLTPIAGAARVLSFDQLVAEILDLLGDMHVVSINERR